jgi:hypothetical protein
LPSFNAKPLLHYKIKGIGDLPPVIGATEHGLLLYYRDRLTDEATFVVPPVNK